MPDLYAGDLRRVPDAAGDPLEAVKRAGTDETSGLESEEAGAHGDLLSEDCLLEWISGREAGHRAAAFRCGSSMSASPDRTCPRLRLGISMGPPSSRQTAAAPLSRRYRTAAAPLDAEASPSARLERFELPTHGFEARCSIQLSYKRPSERPFTKPREAKARKKFGQGPAQRGSARGLTPTSRAPRMRRCVPAPAGPGRRAARTSAAESPRPQRPNPGW